MEQTPPVKDQTQSIMNWPHDYTHKLCLFSFMFAIKQDFLCHKEIASKRLKFISFNLLSSEQFFCGDWGKAVCHFASEEALKNWPVEDNKSRSKCLK